MMSTQDFPPPTRVSKTAYVQRIRLVASGRPSHATAPQAFDLSAVGSASLGQGRIEAIEERPLKAQDLRSAAFQCVCPAVGASTVRPQQSPSFSDRDGIGPRRYRTAMVSDRAPRTCSLQYPLSGLQTGNRHQGHGPAPGASATGTKGRSTLAVASRCCSGRSGWCAYGAGRTPQLSWQPDAARSTERSGAK